MFLDAMAVVLPNSRICITGDSDVPAAFGTAIMVSNHFAEADWWVILMLCRCIGLKGSVKLFLHKSLHRTPFLGRIFRLLDYPFLGDSWISYRARLLAFLKTFNEDTNPALFLLFPEGGELSQENIRQSIEFAKREGRPNLKHLLLPRTTGFNASLDALRASHPVVYDLTVAYKGYKGKIPKIEEKPSLPKLWEIITTRAPEEVHVRIKRYR